MTNLRHSNAKGVTKRKGIRKPRVPLTPAQEQAIRTRYPHERTDTIAMDIGLNVHQVYRKATLLGLTKTAEYLASPEAGRLRRGSDVGAQFRFPKGHVPANKGKKGIVYPGTEATQFKKGSKPHTWKPVGTIRYSKEGYLQVKLTDTGITRKDYVCVHHLVWELHGGTHPAKHHVSFKDGNKSHITLDNLELVSFADMMKRNTIHNMPEELKEVVQLQGALKRRITCHERRKRA